MLNDRHKSEDHSHSYFPKTSLVDDEATQVHGITIEHVKDKPLFEDIAKKCKKCEDRATKDLRHAHLDLGVLDFELKLTSTTCPKLNDIWTINDSFQIPCIILTGQKNTLAGLVPRFDETSYDRELLCGLKEASILADLILQITGVPKKCELISSQNLKSVNQESLDRHFKD